MKADTPLLYLYGIVPAAVAVPRALTGVGGGEVKGVGTGTVQALVSPVDPAEYGGQALNERLSDLEWVGARVARHEAVLLRFLEKHPVVPMQPFSIHAGEQALRDRIEVRQEQFTELLRALAGKAEWNVRIWVRPGPLKEVLERYSDEARALQEEARESGPGRQYLIERKRETLTRDLIEPVGREEAAKALRRLSGFAEGLARRDIPAGAGTGNKRLLAQAALLVERGESDRLRSEVARIGGEWTAGELEIDLTGPWPPYHFVEGENGEH